MSRVGEKIKEARLKAGMTQKALGKKLGVAEKFINEVEIGRKIVQESFAVNLFIYFFTLLSYVIF